MLLLFEIIDFLTKKIKNMKNFLKTIGILYTTLKLLSGIRNIKTVDLTSILNTTSIVY